MKKRIGVFKTIASFWACLPILVSAQSVEQLYKAGNESLSKNEYYAAAKYFKQALEKEDAQAEIWYGFAEASRLFNDYKNATKGYENTLKTDKENVFPLCNFWLGNMLMNQGEYEEAKQRLTAFQNKYRKKDFYALKVQQLIESCAWAIANNQEKAIEVTHLGDSVNSTFSELNPFISNDGKLYYSSTKPVRGKTFRTQIISSENGESFLPGISETSAKHIANGFFSKSENYGSEIYFTQCNTENGNTRCKIFISKLENNEWNAAKELPFNINLQGYTATHPNVLNQSNGKQWLFFTSNRPGTKGKMDIWFSKRLSTNEWDYPQNAGSNLNSIDDEVTPFVASDGKSLFFSSQWHYGYGGFDVFNAEIISLDNAEFSKPKNLGKPINSGANELYYASFDSVAFFSSNRVGSKFIEAETCCNDIYKAENKEQETFATVAKQSSTIIEEKTERIFTDTLKQSSNKNEQITTKSTEVDSKEFLAPKINSSTKSERMISVTLYFHNDEPNPKTLSDTTLLSYVDAYESYINLEQEYENVLTKNLKENEKTITKQKVRNWFADSVEGNFLKLVNFVSQIEQQLNQGKQTTINIAGYCSPLNYNEYNLHLGNRRAASVFNFVHQFKKGALQKFIESGSLKIKLQTLGEETAPKTVSDNLNDLPKSVYSLEAAIERRAVISVDWN